ncbi:hypothetical protein IQ250_17585 [Pseudanabaenaceae cyanobacterium LEGE 13415]|nr:hypothetical protein [Pseudanabaenaceae cyanobacterium LEGE 13415]
MFVIGIAPPTVAQLVPDNSLGSESSIVTPRTVNALPADVTKQAFLQEQRLETEGTSRLIYKICSFCVAIAKSQRSQEPPNWGATGATFRSIQTSSWQD